MSEVVIRCPNCGTTQSALGECDACHDADAQYFCTNHTPGRWLDGPACGECGARFGAAPVRDRPSRQPAAEVSPRVRAEPPAALGRRTPAYDEPERTVDDVWTGPVHAPHRGKIEEVGAGDPRLELPPPTPFPTFDVRVVPMGGCLRRLVVLVLILLALAALAFFGLLGVGSRLLFGAVVEPAPMSVVGVRRSAPPEQLAARPLTASMLGTVDTAGLRSPGTRRSLGP